MILLPRENCQERLRMLFPPALFDTVASNQLAASAVFAMLYADAVAADDPAIPLDGVTLVRPTATLWMSDEAARRQHPDDRRAWAEAAAGGKKALATLHRRWGAPFVPWYADNTRETLRDEIYSLWEQHGALREKSGLPTTSSSPRWALTRSFAQLFRADLTGAALGEAVTTWQHRHLGPGARLRIQIARQRAVAAGAVQVNLPDGTLRLLAPGEASHIMRGVVQQWAVVRLVDPVVIAISEPGDKLYVADAATLRSLGLTIDVSHALPDAVIADIGVSPVTFWLVEVVATDGAITEARRQEFLGWAALNRVPPEDCRFLSAFASRYAPAARRRLRDLAGGTFAWFLDEPDHELHWYQLSP